MKITGPKNMLFTLPTECHSTPGAVDKWLTTVPEACPFDWWATVENIQLQQQPTSHLTMGNAISQVVSAGRNVQCLKQDTVFIY